MWEQIKNEFNRQSHTIVNQRKDVYLTGGGSNKMAGSGLYNNEDFDKGM